MGGLEHNSYVAEAVALTYAVSVSSTPLWVQLDNEAVVLQAQRILINPAATLPWNLTARWSSWPEGYSRLTKLWHQHIGLSLALPFFFLT